jgi:hypothetical protein
METAKALRLPAIAGVMGGVVTLLLAPLYFLYSGPPPAWDVFTRDLFDLLTCAFFIVFLAGFRDLLRRAGPADEWARDLMYGSGLIYVAVTLVAASMEAGGVFGHPGGTIDPTSQGPLGQGSILMHGSVTRILTVLFMVAAGYAVERTKVLPAWIGRAAYGIAACNLAFVPSIYFGSDSGAFYSALGWGNTAVTASLLEFWVMAAGITILRRQRTGPARPETAPVPPRAVQAAPGPAIHRLPERGL